MRKRRIAAMMTAVLAAGAMFGSSIPAAAANEDYYEETVTVSLLVDQNWLDTYGEALQALSDAALEKFNIEIELENKTNGSDGDNIVKTRLAAGEMTDLLIFNSGAQFTALNPAEYFMDITDEDFAENIDENFKASVTVDGKVYGIPVTSSNVGGIVYNLSLIHIWSAW